jgi:hypothetical protein
VCAYPKVLEVKAAEHGDFRPPENWEHNSRRHLIRLVPPIPGLWTCFVHTNCVCNEIVSARNRVLGETPVPTLRGIKELKAESIRLASKFGHRQPWSLDEVLESFKGARRTKYVQAYDSLLMNPLTAGDARIQSFVKAEKFDPEAKVNPDPRMIQARSPRYNLCVAKYLRPVEHIIYGLQDEDGDRMVAKGLNQRQRADRVLRNFASFRNPVCFSLDCARWDKHVKAPILNIEHGFYKAVLPGHPEFERLLAYQMVNRCRTSGGVKYVVNGGRMSGDINTALGNVLLMVLMVKAAMRRLGVPCKVLDDGDDCLVWVEGSYFDRVSDSLPKIFLEYGQELKVENIAWKPSEVVFCQSRLVHNGEEWIMVRDWRKVLSQACCGTRHWNDPAMVRPMMGLVGACELALNVGVPILQAFALALIRNSRGQRASVVHTDSGLAARLKAEFGELEDAFKIKMRPVTAVARAAFTLAYGVEDWEQRAIENSLLTWTVDKTDSVTVPQEWASGWEDTRSLAVHIPLLH